MSKFTSYLERNPNIINDTNYEGATVLHVSTRNNSPNFIKVYLDLGADINAKDRHGTTALMYASRNGNLSDLNLLLSGRANLNRKDKQGKNVLFYCLENEDAFEFLVNKNTDIYLVRVSKVKKWELNNTTYKGNYQIFFITSSYS